MIVIEVLLYIILGFGILLSVIKILINIYIKKSIDINEKKISTTFYPVNLSIHIPTRAEPFNVVKKTIDSIYHQIGSKDEIIVIDNNHTNESLYKPLEQYCKKLNIEFQHFDYIPGFKAGALNKAINLTSGESNYILVIDCDYILNSNAISVVKNFCSSLSNDYSFVQFPQAYLGNESIDVQNELFKYFSYNLEMNRFHSLATGTLCCIRKKDLIQIGKWPVNSITEDAQFGLNIQQLGKTGLFINQIIGRGHLPYTIKDLINQRNRWIYGNAQVLFANLSLKNIDRTFLSSISQLSTWLEFGAISIIFHILFLLPVFEIGMKHKLLIIIYIHYTIVFTIKVYEFLQLPISFKRQVNALLIQWNFFFIASFHWLPVLLNKPKEFIRTPKFNLNNKPILQIPSYFLILNILTLIIYRENAILVSFSTIFISLQIMAMYTLLKNYSK